MNNMNRHPFGKAAPARPDEQTVRPAQDLPPHRTPRRGRTLAVMTIILLVAFAKPLYDLMAFAWHDSLYSYILIIPAISLYLVWQNRQSLKLDTEPFRQLAVLPLLAGLALLAGYGLARHRGWKPATEDYLACMTLAFLLFSFSMLCLFLGRRTLRQIAFPLGFLIFMSPFPVVVLSAMESFLQHASAEAAYALLRLTGIPVFRNGTYFQLPGITFEVAPECSGIRSSLVLFITSLLAGYLLLRRPWARTVLVLAVIPLGILRNGVRITVLGHLCVHVSPEMIHSALHRQGGPLFFAASLVPLFLLLWFLYRQEHRRTSSQTH